jgi:phage-related protein (TIGR01555 family)
MKLAMDSAYPINPAPNFAQIDALLIDSTFMGYPQMSMLMQNGIISRILNILADEMFRKGYKFVCTGDEDKTEKIKELQKEFDRLDVKRKLHWATKITFAQGSCLVVPKIKNDDNKLTKEFIVDSPQYGKGDLEYLAVLEPSWFIPVYFNTWNPRSEMFYKVQTYSLMGTTIDHTRVIKLTYNEAPNLWKPVYNFNGIPLIQQCIPYIAKFEAVMDEIVNIISRYNLSIFSGDIASIIGANSDAVGGESILINRLRVMNLLRNNTGIFAIDKEGEGFEQLQIQLGTLDKLLSQFTEFLAIVPGITTTKFFGQPLQGMNSSGEFELKTYYDEIGNKQRMLDSALERIKELAMINIWGVIDPEITIEWEKLNENTPKEEAEIQYLKAQTGQLLITSGAITPGAETQRIIDDEENDYAGMEIDPDDMDALAQEREERAESMPAEEQDSGKNNDETE